jgi:hypothetical protein
MTAQGSAQARFTRAIAARSLFQVEVALRELRGVSLFDALDYLDLLAEQRPEKLEQAAIRWHSSSKPASSPWPSPNWPSPRCARCAVVSGTRWRSCSGS